MEWCERLFMFRVRAWWTGGLKEQGVSDNPSETGNVTVIHTHVQTIQPLWAPAREGARAGLLYGNVKPRQQECVN